MQREDYKDFIKFKEHGFGLSDFEFLKLAGRIVYRVINGDALATMKELPDESIALVVTSSPYWNMADYGVEGQLGQTNYEDYLEQMVPIWKETHRF